MSRRQPGEHEPGEIQFTQPFPTRWLVWGGAFAAFSLMAGTGALVVLALTGVRLDPVVSRIILAFTLGPMLILGLMVGHVAHRYCFSSGPRRPPVTNPTWTDRCLEANDRRERWAARSLYAALRIMVTVCLVLCSPALHRRPLDWFLWCLLILLFAPLVLHCIVFSMWRAIEPVATCVHCGTWFFDAEMRQVGSEGPCPGCGYPEPLPVPEGEGGDDQA